MPQNQNAHHELNIEELIMITSIRAKYESCWALNDPGHRYEHFVDVYQTAKIINEKYTGEKCNWREMLLVAFFHDLFSWSRNNHHTLAEQFLLTTNCDVVNEIILGSHKKLWLAAKACAEHRASYTGNFSSSLSQIMSAADRGLPSTAAKHVERSYAYHLNRSGDPHSARLGAICHIKEKYGRHGYARYPDLYLEMFKEDLEKLWDEIDSL